MDRKTLIKTIKDHLKKDDLQAGFNLLDDNLQGNGDKHTQFLMLNHRYNRNKTVFFNDTLAYDKYCQEDNKIVQALMHLVGSITESDLKTEVTFQHKAITNPILVICSSETSQNYMQEFFNLLNFKKAKVIVSSRLEDVTDFDLVIFDNRALKDCPASGVLESLSQPEKERIQARVNLMSSYLSDTDKFLVHFGERLYWINDNRERVYAANSKFALHARVGEMLDFINSYRT